MSNDQVVQNISERSTRRGERTDSRFLYGGKGMNNIFYIVGVVVVALAVLGYLGLR
jgi:hypothetical protein